MKGLKAAVALLKDEIVVSDKVWKKRQCKNRDSEGQSECLISLSAENTHRGRLYPWWKIYDIGDDQKHLQRLSHHKYQNLFQWFYAKSQRDKQT